LQDDLAIFIRMSAKGWGDRRLRLDRRKPPSSANRLADHPRPRPET
jgi:hypothetical protein